MSVHKKKIPVIDLFAGVGGLSLGAARAGFRVAAAVEWDELASATHHINFPEANAVVADIASLDPQDLLSIADVRSNDEFGIIGGPPCQGFSSIGKRDPTDPRNSLFAHFFRIVSECNPSFFVAENVPGILDEKNVDQLLTAFTLLGDGYVLNEPLQVAADDLGVPTVRERVFFVGIRKDVVGNSTPKIDLEKTKLEARPVTVGESLFGLPPVRSTWDTEDKGWRPLTAAHLDTFYGESLRDRVPSGVGHEPALRRLREGWVSGCMGTRHDEETVLRFRRLRPGDIDPISRAKRLHEDGFCPTIRAGTGADRGSYQACRPIHYSAPRVISPREAARLQGFPDWFVFHGTKWHSFRQIGNSVSPLVAEHVLGGVSELL